ncbi:hypothetical protein [Pseudomonas matsuisoli]|uniref:Uncharacterized protein n=1 Tax=Pseudomonas matsuisoli TaxID=1515666 RepID=A0A917Q178_9PSED|nr:hypothetical protein [Pseudomonas matsuisoli]GGK06414.1 hypothetical protein GCM10009304_35680 [Pseudomonas matsuisoli]
MSVATKPSEFVPAWQAYDMRMMLRAFQREGLFTQPAAVARLESMLGRPLRRYRDFVQETVATW